MTQHVLWSLLSYYCLSSVFLNKSIFTLPVQLLLLLLFNSSEPLYLCTSPYTLYIISIFLFSKFNSLFQTVPLYSHSCVLFLETLLLLSCDLPILQYHKLLIHTSLFHEHHRNHWYKLFSQLLTYGRHGFINICAMQHTIQ